MTRVLIYARLSQAGEDADLRRQTALCEQRARGEGWEIAGEFIDNGTSAWNPRIKRPRYEDMIDQLDGCDVLAYNADRLFRQDKDRLRFFEAYTAAGRQVVRFVDGMDADLTTADGRKYFRDLGSAAEHQSDRASERVQRKMEQLASEGKRWGGRRPFGYTKGMEPDPREVEAIRRGVELVLSGATSYQVAITWNAEGVTTPSGGRWRAGRVKDVLLGPVIAGVRRHERTGKEFPGAWPAIISTDERQLLISLLKRKSGRPKSRKYPLSGILVCSECGRGMGGRTQPGGRRQYACPDQHMSIAGNATEDLVLDAVQERDQAYGRKRALRGPSRENHDTVLALGRLTEQRQTLEMAAELGAEVGDAISRLNAEETALRATVDPEAAPTVPKDDPERRDRRHRGELTEAEVLQSAEWVRSWVRSVTVQPAKHTKTPPSERLEIAWRD